MTLTILEDRSFKVHGYDKQYQVCVISTPAQWLPASSFKQEYVLSLAGKKIRIPLSGVSYAIWEELENLYPFPDFDDTGEVEYLSNRQAADKKLDRTKKISDVRKRRQIYMFEHIVGQKIPGENIEEKVQWVDDRAVDEIERLYSHIENDLTCINDSELLSQYNEDMENSETQNGEVVDFTTFESWESAEETKAYFRMARSLDDCVCEFPLKKISAEAKQAIDEQTIPPEPPKIPQKNTATGRLDPRHFTPNTKDTKWIQSCRAVDRKKLVLMLDSVLPFKIPGGSIDEKYKWLGERLVGDIIKIQKYVLQELFGYRRQFDFFT